MNKTEYDQLMERFRPIEWHPEATPNLIMTSLDVWFNETNRFNVEVMMEDDDTKDFGVFFSIVTDETIFEYVPVKLSFKNEKPWWKFW